MGFQTVTTLATAAENLASAVGEYQQGKALKKAAAQQEALSAGQAESMTHTALQNQQREQRNAAMQMAQVRADAAGSSLLREGSALQRETDMATRLADDITNRTNAALQETDRVRMEGALEAWNTRVQAANARRRSVGRLLGGAAQLGNSLFSLHDGEKK